MVKEKRILSYILGWLIVGFIIIFMGVNNVFAASYDADNFTAQIYDNINGSLTAKTTTKETSGSTFYYSFEVGYTEYSSGGAWGISSPIPLLANHTYSMTVNPMVIGCGFTILSTVNRIGVGTNLGNAVTSYQNNTNVNEKFSKAVSNSRYLQYVFTPTINASYIVFPFSTTSNCSGRESQLSNIVIEDLGESGISQDQINTSLNNQTNEINSSIQNSTNTITGEINDMENSIIDSNKETQEVIKDQFNSCRDSYNLLDQNDLTIGYISSTDGTLVEGGGSSYTTNILNLKNITYTLSGARIQKICYYDDNNNWVSCETGIQTFSLNEYTKIRLQFLNTSIENIMLNEGNIAKPYEPYGEICSNKIDETNDKLDGIQGALTDSSSPNTSGLENSAGWLPAGPLDSILNLPLTMLNSLTNSLGKTCSPLNLTLPYVNKNIEIPCLSTIFSKITGVNGLWTWVGTIASILILYNYLLNLYAWVDRILTLRAEFDEAMGADMANWGRL